VAFFDMLPAGFEQGETTDYMMACLFLLLEVDVPTSIGQRRL